MLYRYLRVIILVISVLTIVSGLLQMISPGLVLSMIKGDEAPAAKHFFGIIGLFMFIFGGLMLQSLYNAASDKVATIWCGLQKAGAAIAVFIGIGKGLFSSTAALVAGFDLLSAVLLFIYLRQPRVEYNTKA